MLDAIAILERTPASLDALLRGLPGIFRLFNEGPGTWSVHDIVGHLIGAEQEDWIPRIRTILDHGDTQPFPPFDRWQGVREAEGKPLDVLLDEFARNRLQSLAQLRAFNLQPTDLERRGQHPAFGSVSLAELISTWAVHDLNHLHQISRVMAHQYREQVGPWREYLGVLHCDGHGS